MSENHLFGTPSHLDLGPRIVTVRASDGQRDTDRDLLINVLAVNDSPIITSSPTAYIDQGSAYNYVITSIDEEGDPIAYDVSKPDWLSWIRIPDTV